MSQKYIKIFFISLCFILFQKQYLQEKVIADGCCMNQTKEFQGNLTMKNGKSRSYKMQQVNGIVNLKDNNFFAFKSLFNRSVVLIDFPRKKSAKNQFQQKFFNFTNTEFSRDLNITYGFCQISQCQKLANNYFVINIPTILIIENGQILYKISLSKNDKVNSIKDFIMQKFSREPLVYNDFNKISAMWNFTQSMSILVNTDNDTMAREIFQKVSYDSINNKQMTFIITHKYDLNFLKWIPTYQSKNIQINKNDVLIFKKYDEQFQQITIYQEQYEIIEYFRNSTAQKVYQPMDLDHKINYYKLVARDQFVYFYNSTDNETQIQNLDAMGIFLQFAQKYYKKYLFIHIDVSKEVNREFYQIFDMVNYLDKLPQIRLGAHVVANATNITNETALPKEFVNYKFNMTITYDNLEQYLQMYQNNQIDDLKSKFNYQQEDELKSKDNQDFTMDDQQFVMELNSRNFKKYVYQKNQSLVFVMFYTNWCAQCQTMAGNWDKLGYQFHEFKNVTVAKFNADQSDPSKFVFVEKYPTLVLFKQNESQPIIYSETDYSFYSMKSFLMKYGAIDVYPEDNTDYLQKASRVDDLTEEENDINYVNNLLPDNFEPTIKQYNFTLVQFYAPWSQAFQQFKYYYNILASLYQNNTQINIAKYNGDLYDTSAIYNFSTFPTILLYKQELQIPILFTQKLTLPNLINFLVENGVQKVEQSDAQVKKLISIIENTIQFEEPLLSQQIPNIQDVFSQITQIQEFSSSDFGKLFDQQKHIVLMAFAPWSINTLKMMLTYDEFAKEYSKDMYFASFNAELYPQIIFNYKFNIKKYPTIMFISKENRNNIIYMEDSFTKESLKKFLDKQIVELKIDL